MKRLLLFALLIALPASASYNVFYAGTNFNTVSFPQYGEKVRVDSIYYSNSYDTARSEMFTCGLTTDPYPAGFWISNMLSGRYLFTVQAVPHPTPRIFVIPDGSGNYTLSTADVVATPVGTGFPSYADITNYVNAHASSGSATNLSPWTGPINGGGYPLTNAYADSTFKLPVTSLTNFSTSMTASNYANLTQLNSASNSLRSVVTNGFVKKAGDTMTGDLIVPQIRTSSGQGSIDPDGRTLLDANGTVVDWGSWVLFDSSAVESVDWDGRQLFGSTFAQSVNWNTRRLFSSDGLTINLDWSSASGLSGNGSGITGVSAATATRLATNATQVIVSSTGASNYWMTVGNTKSNSFWFNTNGSLQGLKWSLNYDGAIQWANGLSVLQNDGTVTAIGYAGSGASLTALPAGQLTGSIADARLSGNVALVTTNAFSLTASNSLPLTTNLISPTFLLTLNGAGALTNTTGTGWANIILSNATATATNYFLTNATWRAIGSGTTNDAPAGVLSIPSGKVAYVTVQNQFGFTAYWTTVQRAP